MAIKDLAVAYNGSNNSDTALQFAIQMCKKYDTALTGLYAHTPAGFEKKIEHWISDDVLQALKNASEEGYRSIEDSFKKATGSSEFSGSVDWFSEEGQPNTVLARAARYYDLLLIGQFSGPSETERPVRAEDLVLRAGTPVIIVPKDYEVHEFSEYAVVAWDASRAAARALCDAMHILETKKRLDVVTVRSDKHDTTDESASQSHDIIRHLKRHGVDAQHVYLSADRGGRGATILDYCGQNKPDVLVMGGYGQTRLREELFGGVTTHVLQNMNVPIFMSH